MHIKHTLLGSCSLEIEQILDGFLFPAPFWETSAFSAQQSIPILPLDFCCLVTTWGHTTE